MENYHKKYATLYWQQGGLCPIALEHGSPYELLTCRPSQLHHTLLHNLKRHKKSIGNSVDAIENLTLVSSRFHTMYPQWGQAENELKAKQKLTRKNHE